MVKPKLTIKEIAKLAGVSPTAVSFAMNNRDGISQATRDKIMQVVRDNDFYPNASSQRLLLKKSFNIAFIYPAKASPFTDLFYYEVAKDLTEELTHANYNVVFAPLEGREGAYDIPTIIKRRDTDGVIFLHEMSENILQELDTMGIPYVLVDWQSKDEVRPKVNMDYERLTNRAVMYLADKGHKNIAFFGSDLFPYYYLRCFSGYQKALTERELPMHPDWIQSVVHNLEDVKNSIERMMNGTLTPTAVCCNSDMCAIGAMQAANQCDIRVPETLSFIGIDNILLSRYVQPSLTTISCKKGVIGKAAADLLLGLIEKGKADSVLIQTDELNERASVRQLD